MAYSPNDRGPDIPPTRSSARSGALWLLLVVVLLVGGFVWYNASGPQTDPGTTASTTSGQTIAPSTSAPAQTGAGGAQNATGATGGGASSSQP